MIVSKHDGDLGEWFGLSYAAFCVLPRVAMEAMPKEWQQQMARLLTEYTDTIDTSAFGEKGCRVQALNGDGKLMKMPVELLNYRHPLPADIAALKLDRVPDECCATGQSCEYAYDSFVKAYQCRYCGGQPPASWTPPLRLPYPETIGDAQVYHFDQLEDLLKKQGINFTVGIE